MMAHTTHVCDSQRRFQSPPALFPLELSNDQSIFVLKRQLDFPVLNAT